MNYNFFPIQANNYFKILILYWLVLLSVEVDKNHVKMKPIPLANEKE